METNHNQLERYTHDISGYSPKQSNEHIFNPNMTLAEAILIIQKYEGEKGITCPCCKGFHKKYKRKLTRSMMRALLMFNRSFETGIYVHAHDFFKEQECPSATYADFCKLRFWGLIKRKEGKKEDGNSSNGYYCVTEKGHQFCSQKLVIPVSVHIVNDVPVSFDEQFVDILFASTNEFNYSDLMSNK